MVESKGWKNTVFDRNFAGKEKKVDVAITHAITKDAYTIIDKKADELTLVAGDSDCVPGVRDLVGEGFKVIVAFWDHASPELRREATSLIRMWTR